MNIPNMEMYRNFDELVLSNKDKSNDNVLDTENTIISYLYKMEAGTLLTLKVLKVLKINWNPLNTFEKKTKKLSTSIDVDPISFI